MGFCRCGYRRWQKLSWAGGKGLPDCRSYFLLNLCAHANQIGVILKRQAFSHQLELFWECLQALASHLQCAGGIKVATQSANHHHVSERLGVGALDVHQLLQIIDGLWPILLHQRQQAVDGEHVFAVWVNTHASSTQGIGQIQLLGGHQAHTGGLLQAEHIKRFSPGEIREAIQTLVATEQLDLAYALGAAGMGIHPHSEDMLAINGLLALMQQDWPQAVDYLQELMDIQGANTQAFTYVMMVRALRCNLDPARALQVARQGLQAFPEQLELVAESLALEDYADLVGVSTQIQ